MEYKELTRFYVADKGSDGDSDLIFVPVSKKSPMYISSGEFKNLSRREKIDYLTSIGKIKLEAVHAHRMKDGKKGKEGSSISTADINGNIYPKGRKRTF